MSGLFGGGGGGGGGGEPAPPPPPPRMDSAAPPPVFQTYGSGDRTGSLVQSGNSWRPSTLDYSKPIYDPNYADNITGYKESSQFYQPIYQPQYNNYTTTNPLGVSQYGTPMTSRSLVDSAYAGIGRYGSGNQTNQADPGGRQFWENALNSGTLNPQNFFQSFNNSVQEYQTQNPNDRYTQYTQNQPGYMGGYQGFMPQMQNPFSSSGGMGGYGQQVASPRGYATNQRSAPNAMRRAEGGIASLMDDVE